jgi:CheY-like chemotaxis protein/nitrogen-specific signal transduction histidine kinase
MKETEFDEKETIKDFSAYINSPSFPFLNKKLYHFILKNFQLDFLALFSTDKEQLKLNPWIYTYTPLKFSCNNEPNLWFYEALKPSFKSPLKLGEISRISHLTGAAFPYYLIKVHQNDHKEDLWVMFSSSQEALNHKQITNFFLGLRESYDRLFLLKSPNFDPYSFLTAKEEKAILNKMKKEDEIAIWKYDATEDRLFLSKNLYDYYKLDPNEFYPQPNNLQEYLIEEESVIIGNAFFNCLQHKKDFHYFFHIKTTEGKKIPAESYGTPITQDGKVQSVVGICKKFSPSKNMNQSINKEKTRLDLALKSTSTFLWDWDMKNDRLFISSDFFKSFSIKCSNDFNFIISNVHPEDALSLRDLLKNHYLEKSSFNATFRIKNQETQEYNWVLAKGCAHWDDDEIPCRMVGTLTDVNKRIKIDLEVEENEKALEELVSITSNQELTLKKKIEALLLLGNKRFQTQCAIINKLNKNNIEPTLKFFSGDSKKHLTFDGLALKNKLSQMTLRKGAPLFFNDLPSLKKETTLLSSIHIKTYLSCPLKIQGGVYGVISFCSSDFREKPFSKKDIIFIKLFSEWIGLEIKKDKDQKRLKDQTKKANSANRAKSLFLANMSHEIRTPLNGILGLSQLLTDTDLSKYQSSLLNDLVKSSMYLKDLVNDVLDFEKNECGQVEMINRPFNLKNLVRDVIRMHYSLASQKRISLHLYYPSEAPEKIIADASKIKQILINLINNALKFTKKGYVILRVLYQKEEKNKIFFKVNDSGVGIAKKDQKRIFDVFHQINNRTLEEHPGSGLGLSIIKKTIALLNGEIRLKSEPGKGSRFTISIPCIVTPPSLPLKLSFKKPKIKIVSQAFLFRDTICKYLNSFEMPENETTSITDEMPDSLENFNCLILHLQIKDPKNIPFLDNLKILIENFSFSCFLFIDLPVLLDNYQITQHPRVKIIPMPLSAREVLEVIKNFNAQDPTPFFNQRHHQKISIKKRYSLSKQKLNALVVEDNPTNLIVISSFLNKLKLNVDETRNGQEALKRVREKEYDIIFMDCRMPFMDGYEATKKIRELENNLGRSPAEIIALTAQTLAENEEKCLKAGMSDFLSKPINFKELEGKIENLNKNKNLCLH